MKKMKFMRIAAVMLILCLASTCAISGTFAKYTTSGTATDSARVAKWGVDVTAATSATIFATAYDGNDGDVISSGTDKVVAPGTNGALSDITITGKPEVKAQVSYAATVDLGDNWVDSNSKYYCPLVVTVNDTVINGIDQTSVENFENAIKNAIEGASKTYDANTDLSTKTSEGVKVEWSWAIETGADAEAKAANNVKDTYLGNLAADADTSNDPQITVTIVVSVTQVGD